MSASSISPSQTFAALRHPNYRIWFFGQLIGFIGIWMQSTAQGYLVFELTQSTTYLGLVSFASGLPSWIFMLYGGVIADRLPRRMLMMVTQGLMMVLTMILSILIFTGWVQPWHIVLIAFLSGIVNAFDSPTRQSFVVELVGHDDLTNAIALNSTMFNTATVLGPAVGGLVYAALGPGWCFTINTFAFLVVIASLLIMRLSPYTPPASKRSIVADIKESIVFVRSEPIISSLIFNQGMVSFLGFGLLTLVPAWAVNILQGDVTTNGMLLSSRGAGALVAALIVAMLSGSRLRGKMWTAGNFVLPLGYLLFAWTRWLPLALFFFSFVGWSFVTIGNICNAMVQSHTPDHLRGRVMGLYLLVFQGLMPLGSLVAGTLAAQIGEPWTVTINALAFLLIFVFRWVRSPYLHDL